MQADQSILENASILFKNLEDLLGSIGDTELTVKLDGWPIGDQLFHIFKSMNTWFINPSEVSTEVQTDVSSKENLSSFYFDVKDKIVRYLTGLSDDDLHQKPKNCSYTRLELIFSQTRHTMYHLGMINALLNREAGKPLVYSGLRKS